MQETIEIRVAKIVGLSVENTKLQCTLHVVPQLLLSNRQLHFEIVNCNSLKLLIWGDFKQIYCFSGLTEEDVIASEGGKSFQ